jgi:cytochrome P450
MPAESHPGTDLPVLDKDFMQDPHGLCAHLRAEGPAQQVITHTGLRVWLVTRYAEAREALADPRLSKDFRRNREIIEQRFGNQGRREFGAALTSHMLNLDPPDHTRLRKLVTKAFTARRVESLRPRVESITTELLDAVSQQSEVDLLTAFAYPLPIRVICELLGVDDDHRGDFRHWSNTLLNAEDPPAAQRAAAEMSEYLVELLAAKRKAPADDLLSALIDAGDQDDALDETELLSMVFLLLVAGHETTVNLIGNAVHALLRHPDQFAALRADPELAARAVEETLRFEGPVNLATMRHTAEPVELGGVAIPAGQIVLVALNSADRDADKFPDPGSFDLDRTTTGHLAFGHGIHFCLGAPLARLEGEIALRELATRFPKLEAAEPVDDLQWRASMIIHGLRTLPVRTGTA